MMNQTSFTTSLASRLMGVALLAFAFFVVIWGGLMYPFWAKTALPVTASLKLATNAQRYSPDNPYPTSYQATSLLAFDTILITQVTRLTAQDGEANDKFGYAVGMGEDTIVVGAMGDDDRAFDGGAIYIFSRNEGGSGNWGLTKKITPVDGLRRGEFGKAVSISGDTVVAGAASDDDNGSMSGAVYIFNRNEGGADNWGLTKKITPADGAASDRFGEALHINRDLLLVGAEGDDDKGDGSGSVYIFSRNEGGVENWGQTKKITPADGSAGNAFGSAVEINEAAMVVGTYWDNSNDPGSGAAYIFNRDEGGVDNWGLTKKITTTDSVAYDLFGNVVRLSGDMLVVGAYLHDTNGSNSGAVYTFNRDEGGADNWGLAQKITPAEASMDDFFGRSVSLNHNLIVVGATGNGDSGNNSGAIYIFNRHQDGADTWEEAQKITPVDGVSGDYFGHALSLNNNNNTLVVGAYGNDDYGDNSGAVYIYQLTYLTHSLYLPVVLK